MCPTGYHGAGDEEYVVTLGSLLDGRVDLFWTGRAICSPAITAAEAVAFARGALRPPLYWDNYPVNDVAMIHEAHLGPYRGRDPLLDRFSVGVMANAMEHAEASKIALATIADYLWEPADYDPERSWQRALAEVGGPDAWALQCFADTVRGSCLAEPDPTDLGASSSASSSISPTATPRQPGRASPRRPPAWPVRRRRCESPAAHNQRLADELRPWLEKFAIGAEAVAAGSRRRRTRAPSCASSPTSWSSRPHVVYGSVLEMAIDRALQQHSEGEHP